MAIKENLPEGFFLLEELPDFIPGCSMTLDGDNVVAVRDNQSGHVDLITERGGLYINIRPGEGATRLSFATDVVYDQATFGDLE